MTDAERAAAKETDFVVDRKFAEYMGYVADASLEDIQNCMKRNLGNTRSHNAQNYQKILQCYNTYNYWGKIDPENSIYELIENRSTAMKEHHGDLTWLYGRLCDYRSRKTLFGIVENWLTFSMASLDSIIEKTFCPYFDLDIMRCDANEVFVDLGAYTGDTVLNYLDSYIGYKKIYCYEIAPHIFQMLKRNLERYPKIELRKKGAGDKNGTMYVTDEVPADTMYKLADAGTTEVPVVTLDEDIAEPVTFVKMDIEGGEQKAILGCKKHIQATHPKLAISIYHNNEDIWKCARMIDEIDSGYKFYLRYGGGNYYPSECVLLGV